MLEDNRGGSKEIDEEKDLKKKDCRDYKFTRLVFSAHVEKISPSML